MTNEELLEEAKRRYPIGTKFISFEDGKTYTVSSYKNCIENGWIADKFIIVNVEESTCMGDYLYRNGIWATVVSTPKPQYELGKWYKVQWRELTNPIYIKPTNINTKSNNIECNGCNSIWIDKKVEPVYKNGAYPISTLTLLHELTDLSEIQQYLPDGHPDKVKLGVFIPKFRQGDRIELVNDKNFNIAKGSVGLVNKDSYIFDDPYIDGKELVNITWILKNAKGSGTFNQANGDYYPSDFKLYEYPEEELNNKFKIDDWFTPLQDNIQSSNCKINTEYQVHEIDEYGAVQFYIKPGCRVGISKQFHNLLKKVKTTYTEKVSLVEAMVPLQDEYNLTRLKIEQKLINNSKTTNNEKTGNICKVSRSNSSKIGSSDITRGTAIKSSSSKGKIGSGHCYH